jgi:septum site-determining protein MinD
MANLSLLLGMQSSPITLHDVLLGESNVHDAIYEGPAGIHFIPSGLSIESYRRVDPERLESVVREIADNYDFVLIDAPAGIEKSVMAALAAAEEVLLVTAPNSPSVADVLKIKIVVQRIGSNPIGVVMNFIRGEKGEISDDDIMKMLELPIYGMVPYDSEVRKSFMQENVAPVIIRCPDSPASVAIQKMAAKLSGVSIEIRPTKKQGGIFSRLFGFLGRKKKSQRSRNKKGDRPKEVIEHDKQQAV